MGNFLHKRLHLSSGNAVRVDIDRQANVMLLTDLEFGNYRRGRKFRYYGGHYKVSPVLLSPPQSGFWNLVIDLGGGRGAIRYNINVLN
jgi:hypothetical protein